jgi:2-C-methyl-D-erythritol 2,4-cyclodiphosphate synthase
VSFRIGIGFDLHRLGPNTPLVIGGVTIPHTLGLIGHSDGDVLCHAITDALLGAAGIGNIGELFPDTDPALKGLSSLHFLKKSAELVRGKGFEIGNIDSNILAERPKLLSFFPAMASKMAEALGISPDKIQVKAKTMEGLGIIGMEQAIAAEAVALVVKEEIPIEFA